MWTVISPPKIRLAFYREVYMEGHIHVRIHTDTHTQTHASTHTHTHMSTHTHTYLIVELDEQWKPLCFDEGNNVTSLKLSIICSSPIIKLREKVDRWSKRKRTPTTLEGDS